MLLSVGCGWGAGIRPNRSPGHVLNKSGWFIIMEHPIKVDDFGVPFVPFVPFVSFPNFSQVSFPTRNREPRNPLETMGRIWWFPEIGVPPNPL